MPAYLNIYEGRPYPGMPDSVNLFDSGRDASFATHTWYLDGVAVQMTTGATSTFTPKESHVGKQLKVVVASSIGDLTHVLGVVNHSGAVLVSGAAKIGSTMALNISDSDTVKTKSFQWTLDGAPISGATSASLQITSVMAGKRLGVHVVWTDGVGYIDVRDLGFGVVVA